MMAELEASQIHMVVNTRKLFERVLETYETGCVQYYVKNGKRLKYSPHEAFLLFCDFFDARGRLVTNVAYDNSILGNAIVEAFYLELKNIGAVRTFRRVLLNILAANGQNNTALFARIFNDKTTRG